MNRKLEKEDFIYVYACKEDILIDSLYDNLEWNTKLFMRFEDAKDYIKKQVKEHCMILQDCLESKQLSKLEVYEQIVGEKDSDEPSMTVEILGTKFYTDRMRLYLSKADD